jgi:hypothetical protein
LLIDPREIVVYRLNPVANCRHCGAETELISFGEPICMDCDKARTKRTEPEPPNKDEELSIKEDNIAST